MSVVMSALAISAPGDSLLPASAVDGLPLRKVRYDRCQLFICYSLSQGLMASVFVQFLVESFGS